MEYVSKQDCLFTVFKDSFTNAVIKLLSKPPDKRQAIGLSVVTHLLNTAVCNLFLISLSIRTSLSVFEY